MHAPSLQSDIQFSDCQNVHKIICKLDNSADTIRRFLLGCVSFYVKQGMLYFVRLVLSTFVLPRYDIRKFISRCNNVIHCGLHYYIGL
jgi:hypothetical protein